MKSQPGLILGHYAAQQPSRLFAVPRDTRFLVWVGYGLVCASG